MRNYDPNITEIDSKGQSTKSQGGSTTMCLMAIMKLGDISFSFLSGMYEFGGFRCLFDFQAALYRFIWLTSRLR